MTFSAEVLHRSVACALRFVRQIGDDIVFGILYDRAYCSSLRGSHENERGVEIICLFEQQASGFVRSHGPFLRLPPVRALFPPCFARSRCCFAHGCRHPRRMHSRPHDGSGRTVGL